MGFIGISNWALDPAKMNRGVMVTRDDPNIDELVLSARGICSERVDDPVKEKLEPYFGRMAQAYKAICAKQQEQKKKEFFGLRDFYRCVDLTTHFIYKKSSEQLC